jgi:hypothetical protein
MKIEFFLDISNKNLIEIKNSNNFNVKEINFINNNKIIFIYIIKNMIMIKKHIKINLRQ